MNESKVFSLDSYRLGLRAEVLQRYHALKGRGIVEEQARNIASAQAAAHSNVKPRPSASVFRRELDDALKPRPKSRHPREGGTVPPYLGGDNWTLPQ